MKTIRLDHVPKLEYPNEDMTRESRRWWRRRHQFFIVFDNRDLIVHTSCSYVKARMAQTANPTYRLVRCQLRNAQIYLEALIVEDKA